MSRWEYCTVRRGGIPGARLTMYKETGPLFAHIKRDPARNDRDDEDAYYRCVAELGIDGWELTGTAAGEEGETLLYFKRPLDS